jgi:hypothetical protein
MWCEHTPVTECEYWLGLGEENKFAYFNRIKTIMKTTFRHPACVFRVCGFRRDACVSGAKLVCSGAKQSCVFRERSLCFPAQSMWFPARLVMMMLYSIIALLLFDSRCFGKACKNTSQYKTVFFLYKEADYFKMMTKNEQFLNYMS